MDSMERVVFGVVLSLWFFGFGYVLGLNKASARESGGTDALAGVVSGKSPAGAKGRRLSAAAKALAILFVAALGLFALHGLFHLWQWLWWPPPDALQALYGASEAGRYMHAVTEAIIALALFIGLWETLRK